MTGEGGMPSPPGGNAEQRRREFERQRGLSPDPGSARSKAEEAGLRGKAFLRLEEFRRQRGLQTQPEGESPAADAGSPYILGAEQKEAMLAATPPTPGIVWKPLGPAGIPKGQTYGSGTTTVAGRISAIAVDPSDSAHLLVGSAAGGVWETHDTGAEWTPRTDDQRTLSIGAIAFDPNDSSVVYAGTGEGNWAYSLLGQGMLRSGDGGSTWTAMASGQELFAHQGFFRIAIDPSDGKRLIVATTDRTAASPDAGATWATVHSGKTWDVSLARPGGETEILLAAHDGLFAATGTAAPARVALPGLPAALDKPEDRLAVAHVGPDSGEAFAFAAFAGAAHLWHRPAAKQPFVAVSLPQLSVANRVEDVFSIKQAWYDWYVAVPAQPAGVVYLGAIELVRGKSSGAGWSWSDISSREHGDSIHPDQHTMAFDPSQPGVIYAGNDGGVFRSPDGGDSWQSLNAGLAISEVEYLTQRPDEATWILAGLQDNGTVRREAEEGGGKWAQVGLGDGGDCATDATDPDTCFYSRYDMTLERSESRGDRDSWTDVTPPAPEGAPMQFYPPLEVNGKLVAKAGDVVYISTDSGDSWADVALPPNKGEPSIATALSIPSADRVLVGTEWGDVFRIDFSGGGWGPPTMLAKPAGGWISDMLVDADLPHRYWATFSNHPGAVFRSDDEGAGWTDVTANLPPIPVNAIVTDPEDRERVWVACDAGVFESTDAGGTWSVYGSGLPNALAEDLAFYAPDRLLRVGTRSRGVWEVAVG
ncbi:MAG TPA: hypothetical protein VLK56_05105 [Solirubrobacterales bacterium]|nr:hypothetical protein [Solirubrobacterales bacterium]